MPGLLTFDSDTPYKFVEITNEIPQTVLILRNYRIELRTNGVLKSNTYPKFVNIDIGNIIGGVYVNDDDPSRRSLAIPFGPPNYIEGDEAGYSHNLVTVTGVHIPLIMSGDLPKNFDFSVRDESGTLIDEDMFVNIFLQFEIV